MEPVSATLMTFGVAMLLVSWVMLIVVSFKEDFTWGLCTIFLPPISYFYCLFSWAKAKDVLLFAVLGWVLIFLA